MTHASDSSAANPGHLTERERTRLTAPIIRAFGVKAGEIPLGLCVMPRCGPEAA
ncbi:MAG: hypothetical protein LC652_11295 [Halomonas sp.]|nr:hypothetical protein [Halomonas sp.]